MIAVYNNTLLALKYLALEWKSLITCLYLGLGKKKNVNSDPNFPNPV